MTIDQMLACGDCLQFMPRLRDGSVDMVIADAPYASGGLHPHARRQPTGEKYLGHARFPDFGGDQRDQRSWYRWCTEWLGESCRVLREGGYCLAFTDWRQLPTLTDAIQAAGTERYHLLGQAECPLRAHGIFPTTMRVCGMGYKGADREARSRKHAIERVVFDSSPTPHP